MTSKVVHPSTDDDVQIHLSDSNYDFFVLDLSASWCGPCKKIAPIFDAYSIKYPNFKFIKVDIDQCKRTANFYEAHSVPSFVFLDKNKDVKFKFGGANSNKLKQALELLNENTQN